MPQGEFIRTRTATRRPNSESQEAQLSALYQAFQSGTLSFAISPSARQHLDTYLNGLPCKPGLAAHWSHVKKGMSIEARLAGREAAKLAMAHGRRDIQEAEVRQGTRKAIARVQTGWS